MESIIKDDSSFKMPDETAIKSKLRRYGKEKYYIEGDILGIVIPGTDTVGRSGGGTMINVKIPEGFNEAIFETLIARVAYPGRTTDEETARVIAEVKTTIQESIKPVEKLPQTQTVRRGIIDNNFDEIVAQLAASKINIFFNNNNQFKQC